MKLLTVRALLGVALVVVVAVAGKQELSFFATVSLSSAAACSERAVSLVVLLVEAGGDRASPDAPWSVVEGEECPIAAPGDTGMSLLMLTRVG